MKLPLELPDRIALPILYGLASLLALAIVSLIVNAFATLSDDALIGGLEGLATAVAATALLCAVAALFGGRLPRRRRDT
jgi:hypothetical protein